MKIIVGTLMLLMAVSSIYCQIARPNFGNLQARLKSLNDGRYRPTPAPIFTRPTTLPPPLPKVPIYRSPVGKAEGGQDWQTIREENEIDETGYRYGFETENGIEVAEVGRLENIGTADEGLRSEGFYQYTGDDGVVYRVDYVADANGGFVAQGDHIPKTPPAIERALAYIASNPPSRVSK